MITIRKVEMTTGNNYYEYSGLSTDDKPTESVGVNSLFLELDTGDTYYLAQQEEETVTSLIPEEAITCIKEFPKDDFYYATLTQYANIIQYSSIRVTFDGIVYDCEKGDNGTFGATEGDDGYDFSIYPFAVFEIEDDVTVYLEVDTETAGEHTIKIDYADGTEAVWSKVGADASNANQEETA